MGGPSWGTLHISTDTRSVRVRMRTGIFVPVLYGARSKPFIRHLLIISKSVKDGLNLKTDSEVTNRTRKFSGRLLQN